MMKPPCTNSQTGHKAIKSFDNAGTVLQMKKNKSKLPTAVQLPSGRWRCQVMVHGKRVSVVEDDAKTAQAKAVAMKAGLIEKEKKVSYMTIGDAIDRYIESRDAILAPTTVHEYKRIRKSKLQSLMCIDINAITQEQIQSAVNEMAKSSSPKSVRNAHALLTAAMSIYKPSMNIKTILPQKQKSSIKIPSHEEIRKIVDGAHGDRAEIPILLAIWLGLRMSEIRGLTWDCIEGDTLHVRQAKIRVEHQDIIKGTKTYSGNRKLKLPEEIKKLLETSERCGKYITNMSARKIYGHFVKICEKAGVPHYRFHDLRHYNASLMLSLGVPDKYAMERMGHATNNMLKTVYQHTMDDKRKEVDDAIDNFLNSKLHTNFHTK